MRMNATKSRIKKRKTGYPRRVQVGTAVVMIYQRKTPAGNMGYVIPKLENGKRAFESFKTEDEAYQTALRRANNLSEGKTQAAQLTNEQAIEYSYAQDALRGH